MKSKNLRGAGAALVLATLIIAVSIDAVRADTEVLFDDATANARCVTGYPGVAGPDALSSCQWDMQAIHAGSAHALDATGRAPRAAGGPLLHHQRRGESHRRVADPAARGAHGGQRAVRGDLVGQLARPQIVDNDHVVAHADRELGDDRTDVAGAAGDQEFHRGEVCRAESLKGFAAVVIGGR